MLLTFCENDFIRSELQQLSDDWWPLEVADLPVIARRIRSCPSLLLDLGGHSGDNHPVHSFHVLRRCKQPILVFMVRPMRAAVIAGLSTKCLSAGLQFLSRL